MEKYACLNLGLAALLTEPGKKPWGMESQWDDGVVGRRIPAWRSIVRTGWILMDTLCLLQDGFALCLLQDGFGIVENHSCLYVGTLAISGWLHSQVGEWSRSKVNQRSSVINKQMNRYIERLYIYIATISRI